jgi:saposin
MLIGIFIHAALSVVRRPVPRHHTDARYCTACSLLVSHIESFVLKATPTTEIHAAANQLCTLIDSSLSAPCSQIATLLTDSLIHFLTLGLSPSAACSAVQLCPQTRRPDRHLVRHPILPRHPGNGCDICRHVASQFRSHPSDPDVCQGLPYPHGALCSAIIDLHATEIASDSDFCVNTHFCGSSAAVYSCDVCLHATSLAREYALSGFGAADIPGQVIDACRTFPGHLSSVCTEFSYQILPELSDDVARFVSASQICEMKKFCPSQHPSPITLGKGDGFFCDVCTEIVDAAAEALIDQKVEEEIEDILEKLCDNLPSVIGIICRSFVAQYTPTILAWLEEGIEALEICQRLGLCDWTVHH